MCGQSRHAVGFVIETPNNRDEHDQTLTMMLQHDLDVGFDRIPVSTFYDGSDLLTSFCSYHAELMGSDDHPASTSRDCACEVILFPYSYAEPPHAIPSRASWNVGVDGQDFCLSADARVADGVSFCQGLDPWTFPYHYFGGAPLEMGICVDVGLLFQLYLVHFGRHRGPSCLSLQHLAE